jgi:hypothetical protein
MKRDQGSMAVLALAFLLAMSLSALLVADLENASYRREKSRVIAEATLVSSLRVRAQALEDIAVRWQEFGRLFSSGDAAGIVAPSSAWSSIQTQAATLNRALSGYKGRIKAIIGPVAEANSGVSEYVSVPDESGSTLGVSPQSQWMRDEHGNVSLLSAAWYRRDWPDDPDGAAGAASVHRSSVPVRFRGASLAGASSQTEAITQSQGKVFWDDRSSTNQTNGGYPRSWAEALVNGAVVPFRNAFYRAGRS